MPLSHPRETLVWAGETVTRTLRFSRDDIAAFARISFDQNPLHVQPVDTQAAQRARFGEVIASGQHSAAVLMGLLATHYSRSADGVAREMLCLNMNFAFKGPVFADQALTLQWRVATVEWNAKLDGALAHLDGSAAVLRAKPAVVARGTILVREGPQAALPPPPEGDEEPSGGRAFPQEGPQADDIRRPPPEGDEEPSGGRAFPHEAG